ncbi:hypothetical protein GALMADRAFT_1337821 [Galerina marginata CBS 339.88]|uniref:DNA-directed RNA polymerase III subunit RPC6 n=1 Tax=Galerina marginata (strain CBS 339.88) TaxID=685588 RepID=A0A067TTW7_GALM3|nr:hypothetical protein GALMADRAFT_1337821 [Galerina marginata CBS 339.88]
MTKRPPNELESRLHQAALSSSKKEITAKQAESVIPDPKARQNALNFLLAVGLLKGLTSSSGHISFRAVSKEEIVATKGLSGEENLVLSHIKGSGNEGIWTKHLKAKTSLHQTVIDRCLKTLTQKRLIKRVPSVQHITRKIYMLEGIEPSISLTGGPWYTDNELDMEFIKHLMEACYKLISDISFPKRRSEGALYPISNAPQYPTADVIRHSLRKARLTETELSVEHVEMLLNVLILDGKIEKLPAFGTALWNPDSFKDQSDDEKSSRKKKRKKRDGDSDDDDSRSKHKRKKHDTNDESDSSNDTSPPKKLKKKKSVKSRHEPDSESDTEVKKKKKKAKEDLESESDIGAKKRKTKKKKSHSSDEESSSDEEERPRKKTKKKKKYDSSQSDSSSDSEPETRRKKLKSTKPSPSPGIVIDEFDTGFGGSVYRAIKEVPLIAGVTDAPCANCPSFEFCKEEGPVNPEDCVYYTKWLKGGTLANEDEEQDV